MVVAGNRIATSDGTHEHALEAKTETHHPVLNDGEGLGQRNVFRHREHVTLDLRPCSLPRILRLFRGGVFFDHCGIYTV